MGAAPRFPRPRIRARSGRRPGRLHLLDAATRTASRHSSMRGTEHPRPSANVSACVARRPFSKRNITTASGPTRRSTASCGASGRRREVRHRRRPRVRRHRRSRPRCGCDVRRHDLEAHNPVLTGLSTPVRNSLRMSVGAQRMDDMPETLPDFTGITGRVACAGAHIGAVSTPLTTPRWSMRSRRSPRCDTRSSGTRRSLRPRSHDDRGSGSAQQGLARRDGHASAARCCSRSPGRRSVTRPHWSPSGEMVADVEAAAEFAAHAPRRPRCRGGDARGGAAVVLRRSATRSSRASSRSRWPRRSGRGSASRR